MRTVAEIVDYFAKTATPSQRFRYQEFFAGPRPGEDRNGWARYMNRLLSNADRDWIIRFEEWYGL